MRYCTLKSSILNALAAGIEAAGIEATEIVTVKNGVVCQGYQIETGTSVNPVVYYSPEETVEAFVDRVVKIAEQPTPEIDTENLVSRERLLSDTYLCLQKEGVEDLVKRPFLNLELFVRLNVDFIGLSGEKGSIKVTKQILENSGLTEDELFEAARKNSVEKVKICTMAEALGAPEELFCDVPFSVMTYSDNCHGAAILALPEVIGQFCNERGYEQVYILPSSTEEVLLLPTETADPSELSAMVYDVNSSTVDPVLQLDPVVYLYDSLTQTVSIASSYRKEVA